ncbi:hypothetical protein [Sulfuricurvum sp.]|uniref:hypothetical protein n=1 Tax=Sulfuricurvum sp. TaxID=2025608 RepID=UPI00356A81B3
MTNTNNNKIGNGIVGVFFKRMSDGKMFKIEQVKEIKSLDDDTKTEKIYYACEPGNETAKFIIDAYTISQGMLFENARMG